MPEASQPQLGEAGDRHRRDEFRSRVMPEPDRRRDPARSTDCPPRRARRRATKGRWCGGSSPSFRRRPDHSAKREVSPRIGGDWTSVDVHGRRAVERLTRGPSKVVRGGPPPSVAYNARAARYTSSAVTPAVTPTGQIRTLENAVTRTFATPTRPGFDSPQLHQHMFECSQPAQVEAEMVPDLGIRANRCTLQWTVWGSIPGNPLWL